MSQQKLIPQTFLQVEQKLAETERLARRPQQEHKLKQCLRQLKTSVRDLKAVLATTGIEFLDPNPCFQSILASLQATNLSPPD